MQAQELKVGEGLIARDAETGKLFTIYIDGVRGRIDNRRVKILIDAPKSDYLTSRTLKPSNPRNDPRR